MHMLDKFSFCPVCGSKNFIIKKAHSKECQDCKFEFYKNPAAAVAAFVFDDKDRLLVGIRGKEPAKGMLDTLGGFVDVGESADEAIIRELKEETNMDVEVEEYLFSIPNTYVYKDYDSSPLDLFFKCRIKNMDNIKIQEEELSEIRFMELKDINPDDFGLKSIREGLKRFLKR